MIGPLNKVFYGNDKNRATTCQVKKFGPKNVHASIHYFAISQRLIFDNDPLFSSF